MFNTIRTKACRRLNRRQTRELKMAKLQKSPSLVRTLLSLLELRRNDADRELTQAKEAHQFNKLAGFHGIREAVAAAIRHVASEKASLENPAALRKLAERFAEYAAEADQARTEALTSERYSDVVGHDGIGTGWLMAKKAIEESL